jgi:hypothetical protein
MYMFPETSEPTYDCTSHRVCGACSVTRDCNDSRAAGVKLLLQRGEGHGAGRADLGYAVSVIHVDDGCGGWTGGASGRVAEWEHVAQIVAGAGAMQHGPALTKSAGEEGGRVNAECRLQRGR